jgi:predicted flap endonuclease-1-like 5' DNA nuclease
MVTSRENEKLKTELEDSRAEGGQLQREQSVLEPRLQQYDSELGLLRFRVKQYEQQTIEKQEAYQNLQAELEECKAHRRYERKEPVFSDFISDQILPGISPEDADEKDDLKEIGGIGPSIEKRLNSLGINSFKQISELTEVSSKQISHAIKFFPGRIERDRWVEQASRLYLEKLRK